MLGWTDRLMAVPSTLRVNAASLWSAPFCRQPKAPTGRPGLKVGSLRNPDPLRGEGGRETYDARLRRSCQRRAGCRERERATLLGLDLLKRGGGHAELILFLHHESLALFVVETEFLHRSGFGRLLVRRHCLPWCLICWLWLVQ